MEGNKKPYLVGLSGGSGCGKTTILNALFKEMPKGSLALICQDNYYLPIEKQPKDAQGMENFDTPDSFKREQLIEDIRLLHQGDQVSYPEYTFNNADKDPDLVIIEPAPIVLIEGLFVFHFQEINELLDYRVFIETEEEERLARRIKRDQEERGYPENEVRYQWEHHVMPAYRDYLLPHKNSCDLTIDNSNHFRADLEVLKSHLSQIIAR